MTKLVTFAITNKFAITVITAMFETFVLGGAMVLLNPIVTTFLIVVHFCRRAPKTAPELARFSPARITAFTAATATATTVSLRPWDVAHPLTCLRAVVRFDRGFHRSTKFVVATVKALAGRTRSIDTKEVKSFVFL